MAIVNEHISADVVEATEFPDMAQRYRIFGVPKSVITVDEQQVEFEGALPEQMFLEALLQALGAEEETDEDK